MDVFAALEKLKVDITPDEYAQLHNFFVSSGKQITPNAEAAIVSCLLTLAEMPEGAALMLKKDMRDIMAPNFGAQFVQQLNKDEAELINTLQNSIQRHLREHPSNIRVTPQPIPPETPKPPMSGTEKQE